MKKVIAIVGPTASGKTELAIGLATKFNGEIISADSRAIYRGLDIGTAKPSPAERRLVRHHLIDIANVGERFTVAEFQKLADRAIADVIKRGKIPFLVGGTGLYVDAVLKGYQFPPEGDPELRYHLDLESDERLRDILMTIDPESYKRVDLQNRRRLLRAVEVALTSGRSFVALKTRKAPAYQPLILGLSLSKKKLFERIGQRFEQWIDRGLLQEIRWVLRETSPDWVSSLGLHYRYLAQYLQGEIGRREAYVQSKHALRAFAKRQMTWFKRDSAIHWIDSKKEAFELVKRFLQT